MMQNKRRLRRNKRHEKGYDRRLQKRWGRALDLYALTHVVCAEVGEKVSSRDYKNLTPPQASTLEALTGLHVSACRVAGEVMTLLCHGYPRGALARCRTLHELAVIACVIADAASDPSHSDLAERFLDHNIVHLRRDALQYQKDHEVLGEEPLDQEYLDKLEEMYRNALMKYGADFKREYGWAKKLVPDDNLRALEKKASLSHVRPHYQWASSEVHAGARGLSHNFIEYRGVVVRAAGKVNVGLVDPATMALGSLLQVTFSLAVTGNPEGASLESVLSMRVAEELRSASVDAFEAAQSEIDRDEEKILNKMKKKIPVASK